jgi:hypothetical protein
VETQKAHSSGHSERRLEKRVILMKTTRCGTVALVVRFEEGRPQLVDRISDDQEIEALEEALGEGEQDPLACVYGLRARMRQEDEDFGDYVETLLSQPFVKPEVREHGLQWLKSKLRIEEFRKSEAEATRTIAEYAFRLFEAQPERAEFFLAGPVARVRIRVFRLEQASQESEKAA